MKKTFTLFAVAFVSVLCISGTSARADNKEVAMTKCTKTPASCEDKEEKCEKPNGKWGKQQGQPTKGAAKKVVEGNTTQNNECRKSAAKRAIASEL